MAATPASVSQRPRRETSGGVISTLSIAVLAIAMSLFVAGACSVAVLQVGLTANRDKRATTRRHRPRAPRPVREPLPRATVLPPARRGLASLTLVAVAVGIGVALAAAVGLLAVALAVALRSAVGA